MVVVLRIGAIQFLIYSTDLGESRRHIHARSGRQRAKFWLEPDVELARNHGFAEHELNPIRRMVIQHREHFMEAWDDFFGT